MGVLRVLSPEGDHAVVWDQKEVEAGDPEALAAIGEAERIFEEQRQQGATAFTVKSGAPARKLVRFTPEVEQIVMVPRIQGG